MKKIAHFIPSAVWVVAAYPSVMLAADKSDSDRPNIIFILCDDMGYGDLACYGQKYIQTPNLDRMAAEGMLFTQAYAGSPVSAPSRASLMTGQHSGHGHVRGNKEYWTNAPLMKYGDNDEYTVVGQEPYDPGHIILPEIMKQNGYTTGMFGKWAGGYEGSCSTPDKRVHLPVPGPSVLSELSEPLQQVERRYGYYPRHDGRKHPISDVWRRLQETSPIFS